MEISKELEVVETFIRTVAHGAKGRKHRVRPEAATRLAAIAAPGSGRVHGMGRRRRPMKHAIDPLSSDPVSPPSADPQTPARVWIGMAMFDRKLVMRSL